LTRRLHGFTFVGPTCRASQRASGDRGALPPCGHARCTLPPTRCASLWCLVREAEDAAKAEAEAEAATAIGAVAARHTNTMAIGNARARLGRSDSVVLRFTRSPGSSGAFTCSSVQARPAPSVACFVLRIRSARKESSF